MLWGRAKVNNPRFVITLRWKSSTCRQPKFCIWIMNCYSNEWVFNFGEQKRLFQSEISYLVALRDIPENTLLKLEFSEVWCGKSDGLFQCGSLWLNCKIIILAELYKRQTWFTIIGVMCWRGWKIACKRFVILRLFEWCLWEWKELGVMIVWEMSQKFFLLLFWYCMNVFDTFYSRNWFETILEWNLIVRMKWVLVKKDSWCWLIFQHPDWKSCSESSGDWKFKGIYWFVVGRVLWLVLRTVNGDWCTNES